MTLRNFYSEYGKPIFITILSTVILSGFAAFIGVRVALATMNQDIQYAKEDRRLIWAEIDFVHGRDEYQGESIFRLISNQQQVADKTGVKLRYTFENLGNTRGRK